MSVSQTVVDEPLDLFDVHGESPSPAVISTASAIHTTDTNPPMLPSEPTNTNIPPPPPTPAVTDTKLPSESSGEHTLTIPKATSLIRSISDKLPLPPPNKPHPEMHKMRSNPHTISPASSPMPPSIKNLALTLDKFSKEDLFKLFGKARKENRVIRQELESLKSKNKDIYKALSASNEQNEVLQITNQHLRDEYNTLKTKTLTHRETMEEELRCERRESEEKMSLIKTQCASYMDEVNRLNEQMDELRTENDVLQSARSSVEGKIGEQYTQFTVQITALQSQLEDKAKENELLDTQTNEMKEEITMYRTQIGKYKDIARKAEVSLERIGSLEEELRDKIRDNHQLQIKTRSLNHTIKRITDKSEKQNEKIEQLESDEIETREALDALKTDHASCKEHNQLLNAKLNILLKENAEHTLKTEKKIERIENHHLSKYKTLLNSFQMMKKRIEANNRMNEMEEMDHSTNHIHSNKSSHSHSRSVGYSNAGWKQYHDDHYQRFSFEDENSNKDNNNKNSKHLTYCIDLEMDEEEYVDRVKDLNHNISELSSHCASYDSDPVNPATKQLKMYQKQVKEYKHMMRALQNQLKQSQNAMDNERNTKRRVNKPKNINVDYLRNVLVKFLILSEYLTDEQVVLVPVLGSILQLSRTEKDMIDNSYNNNRYFMGTNTLFPETANAKYSPRKKRKKKKGKRKETSAPPRSTSHI